MCLFFWQEDVSKKPPADISLRLIGLSWSILRAVPGKREQAYYGWLWSGLPHLLRLSSLLSEQNQDSVGRREGGVAAGRQPTESASDGKTHEQKSSV